MSRRATFSQTDITRALKGCKAAGINVGKFEIDTNGKLVVFAAGADDGKPVDDLDRELAEFEARHGQD